MKSKSFDLKKSPAEKGKGNKTFDFVGFYKSAAETNVKLIQNPKAVEKLDKENSFNSSATTIKREQSPNKKKKKGENEPLEISHINIDGDGLNVSKRSLPLNSRATSTPVGTRKAQSTEPKVKSIMKNSSMSADATMEDTTVATPPIKPKKRNKSVSFMLDDTEEIAIKKTKSEDSLRIKKTEKRMKPGKQVKDEKDKKEKFRKKLQAAKENKNIRMETDQSIDKTKSIPDAGGDSTSDGQSTQEKKKKLKKIKKRKKNEENSGPTENDSNNNEDADNKPKKLKKKKQFDKLKPDVDEESATLKKEVIPELIAEDLENLSIGDNAHTLTNLLDEMTVVDKDKKKRNKLRRKKEKTTKPASISSSETADLEKIEEGKEKVKWKKRKWNKDKKGDVNDDVLATSVIVENLPLKIMCSYKKLLADHFGPCGLIKKIGIAEVYPTEEPKPVFTTSINFYSEDAASKALEEDNTVFENSRIRVKQPLPAMQTTIVVRSYAELTEQNLSSVFTGAGRIRNIRHLVKGKKSMATAFIEFDGPQAVERAIKMAEDAKIGGKKIHVSKFELRGSRHKQQKIKKNVDSENEGDSEDSND